MGSSRPFSDKQNKINLSSGYWIKDFVDVGKQGGARTSQGTLQLYKGRGLREVGLHCRRRHGLGDEGLKRPSTQCPTQLNGCLPSPSLP